MKTYKANVVCSIANNDKGTPTCKLVYKVTFDTALEIPLSKLGEEQSLIDNAVTACGNALYEEYFKFENVEYLDELKEQLNEEGKRKMETFMESNRVKFEQHLVHA